MGPAGTLEAAPRHRASGLGIRAGLLRAWTRTPAAARPPCHYGRGGVGDGNKPDNPTVPGHTEGSRAAGRPRRCQPARKAVPALPGAVRCWDRRRLRGALAGASQSNYELALKTLKSRKYKQRNRKCQKTIQNKTKKHNSNNKMVTKNPENHERATQGHRAGEGRRRELLGAHRGEELPHLGTHGAVREGLAFMLLNSQKEEQWLWLKNESKK